MKNIALRTAAAAFAFSIASAAPAQQVPPAVIGIVDSDQIMRDCTVCAAANTQLEAQLTQLRQRAEQLGTPLQTEQQAIETALRALGQNASPDQALTQRIQAFQTRQNAAQQEVGRRQAEIERNVAFVRQQIAQRVNPAIQQVMQQRGVTIALDRGATLAHTPAVDITQGVLAVVNQNTTPLNVNAPPPPQAPAQQQPQQNRPQGR